MNLAEIIRESYQTAVIKGWWEEDRNIGELLALMHSEISEALEEWRTGRDIKEVYYEAPKGDNPEGKPCGFPVELADIIIRIGDLCGRTGIPLEHALIEKLRYNRSRPYRHGNKLA